MRYVELTGASYHYHGHLALHPIHIAFEANKITAIIGRSGSGKSTLLQLINGLLKPSAGTVTINQSVLNDHHLQAARLQMGYAVQGNGLFPHLNVEQNVSIAGKIASSTVVKANRVDELLGLVNLPVSYRKKYPHELSGGEQQRVSICRALYLNPPLLLMDEPFGALDPITRHEIQQEVLKIQKIEPRTILIVSHDMREVRKLADAILVLEEGKLQQFDATEKVIQSPANDYVRHLIEVSIQ